MWDNSMIMFHEIICVSMKFVSFTGESMEQYSGNIFQWSKFIFSLTYSYTCWMRMLTHCGLVTPYVDRDLGQHWLKLWLVAWWHQAITWTNVDWSSVKSSDIHIRAISREMPQPSINEICLKITCLKFLLDFPGVNEFTVAMKLWVLQSIWSASTDYLCRDQSKYASSQWETLLHCNDVSHWLVAYLDWSLFMCFSIESQWYGNYRT